MLFIKTWLKNGSKKLRKFQLLCSDMKWTLYEHLDNMDSSEMQLAESN